MAHSCDYQDERLMRRSGTALVWCRVRGQAIDARDPTAASAWSFEALSQNMLDVQRLNPREREVVALMAQGLSSKEMARQFGPVAAPAAVIPGPWPAVQSGHDPPPHGLRDVPARGGDLQM
jgi:hypothetical protein